MQFELYKPECQHHSDAQSHLITGGKKATLVSRNYAFTRLPSEDQGLTMTLWNDPVGVSSGGHWGIW